jgi:putative membrane protein
VSRENKIASFIFLFFLTIGLIGLLSPLEPTVKKLSFYNLFLTFGLVTFSLKDEIKKFGTSFLIVFSIGFIAELIGVHTGYLFGNYSYSSKLGFSMFDVPLIIGINWAILSFGAWNICKKITSKTIINILISSLLMVIFDICMEPTAINLGYWKWDSEIIPLYNYISWFLISIPAIYTYNKLEIKNSGISKVVFISQLFFFILLSSKTLWF